MSESVSPPEDSRTEHKNFNIHKWRGKLFSSEAKSGKGERAIESNDDDIAKFLQAAATTPEAPSKRQALAPRIDTSVAPRWPNATDVSQPGTTLVDVYRRPKARQNKGLHVSFSSAAPKVIGEGGDEAELPSKDVSLSSSTAERSDLPAASQPLRSKNYQQRLEAIEDPPNADIEASFRPTSLPRRSTGLGDDSIAKRPSEHDSRFAESVSALSQSSNHEQYSRSPDRVQAQTYNIKTNVADGDPLDAYISNPNDGTSDRFAQNGNDRNARFNVDAKQGHVDQVAGAHSQNMVDVSNPFANPLKYESSHQENSVGSNASLSGDKMKYQTTTGQSVTDLSTNQSYRTIEERGSDQFEQKALSLRNVAKGFGRDALDDFDRRVQRFNNVFRMGVEVQKELGAIPFARWIIISSWWFLKGRAQLESAVRSKPNSTDGPNKKDEIELSRALTQAYVNLGKAWWIVKDVTPNHPDVTKFGKVGMNSMITVLNGLGHHHLAELVEVHLSIVASMRTLAMSMKRNGRLPPDDLEIQRLEVRVLLKSAALPSSIAHLLVNSGTQREDQLQEAVPYFPIPLGDTTHHFSFGRMFVDVILSTRTDAEREFLLPCILSVIRQRTKWGVQAVIASQDGQVNTVVHSESDVGLTWKDVHWNVSLCAINFKLSDIVDLRVQFSEKDFKTLWGIYDYTHKIRKEFSPRKGEELVFDCGLDWFRCSSSASFPPDPVDDCEMRLFEKKIVLPDSHHVIHDGHRLMVVTPPGIKTMSIINQHLGKESPILSSRQQSKNGPILTLKVPQSPVLSLSFHETQKFDLFRCIMSGKLVTEDDTCSQSIPLQSLAVTSVPATQESTLSNSSCNIPNLRWSKLRIVNKASPPQPHSMISTVPSTNLRILTEGGLGTFVDRISLGQGDLQVNLSVDDLNEIKLLRAPQQEMTWSVADGILDQNEIELLCHTLQTMASQSTIRTYAFRSVSDTNKFQAMVTGFTVSFDGVANIFAISRRRSVVPIHKRWEASTVRLQVIKQDKTVQLVGFFKDFSHGACMNFVLKVTDVFEGFSKSGIFGIRIVDAKFALPKGLEDSSRDFLNLDMPDYPAEHDDIMIGFVDETGTYHFRCRWDAQTLTSCR